MGSGGGEWWVAGKGRFAQWDPGLVPARVVVVVVVVVVVPLYGLECRRDARGFRTRSGERVVRVVSCCRRPLSLCARLRRCSPGCVSATRHASRGPCRRPGVPRNRHRSVRERARVEQVLWLELLLRDHG